MTGDRPGPDTVDPDGSGPGTWAPSPRRFMVNVADLRRRLGQRLTVDIDMVVPPITVIASSTTPDPVVGSVVVESIERGVSVLGSVWFHWTAECRRCLEDTGGVSEVTVDEIFQVDAPEDSELIDFDGEQIDLVPIVTETVGLSLPLAPLCRPDCPGPDPDRYPPRSETDIEPGAEPAADPRWAALAELDLGDDPAAGN
ncbi:MAG: YceD family protein [Acidimicrobiales bacterium]